jgi:hypothetical protein
MKKACIVVGKDYQCNRLFDLSNKILNRDDCLKAFYLLKEKFKDFGYELSTHDINSIDESEIVLYNEMPNPFKHNIIKEKSYLMIFESELIRPDNWDLNKHNSFKKIFTWHDPLVDQKVYFKFNFPNTIKFFDIDNTKRPKLVTLISGNKTCTHSKELYSKRLEIINWFERNTLSDFEYFGIGWDYQFSMWWQKVFRKLKILKYIPKNPSVAYRGKVDDKYSTLLNYQFSICFENGRDIEGYITEKIFDCFFSGSIPVYLGANNVQNYIPQDTFIDMNKFNSYAELHKHLKEMPLDEIQKYQKNILSFLQSDKVNAFTNEYFAKTIAEEVLR